MNIPRIPPPAFIAVSTAVMMVSAFSAASHAAPPEMTSLRAAITNLEETFGERYPRGKQYLSELATAERRGDTAWLKSLARRALLDNPLVREQPILFVVRNQYRSDHHNTATMFQTGEINTGSYKGGGAVRTIDLASGKVTTLLELPEGVARDPEISFDGRKILFSMRRDGKDDYHLYEMAADGSGLTQITTGTEVADIDPIYLPDGTILFGSTREPKYCLCNRHIMCNLYTINADGSGIQQIGHSTLHEGHPALLPDGRVIYDRWEYVDRNFGDAQGTWVVYPDGTNHAIYYGNNTNSPGGVIDARPIPGTQKFIATFTSCHDRPWGALAIVDRRLGLNGRPPVQRIWPDGAIDLVGRGNYDTFKQVHPKYEDPYPMSDTYFLCSRMTGKNQQMGIYLLDLFGNETLIHSETKGCFDPMPLAARNAPPRVAPRVDLANPEGYFYVADVYVGSGMDRVERGSIKSLRVVESPEKRFWTRQAWIGSGAQAPGMAFDDFSNKRILGTVPVERDGSAYFCVPADRFVYFQLLDERGMMVQSMRSGTIVRPGETAGCIGCHDRQQQTVEPYTAPLALKRTPSKLVPWHDPARKFNYALDVQPAFDKHCVSCHDYGKPAGKKLNLAGDQGLMFNASYFDLRTKHYIRVVGAGPALTQPPLSWGSHVSRLTKVLLEGHGDPKIDAEVKLDAESFDRIVTWIDINAPYYPEYASAYPANRYGRSPLDVDQLERLGALTKTDFSNQKMSAHISFTRPEKSPCLTRFNGTFDRDYREALAIIRDGQAMLRERPRADMPGFRLLDLDAEREAKYQFRDQSAKKVLKEILDQQP